MVNMPLWFNDFVMDDEENIIFSSGSFNGLFRANLKSGKSELIDIFPGENMLGVHLYCGMHKYGDNILFVPAWAEKFMLYNIKSKKFHTYMTGDDSLKNTETRWFFKYFSSILVGKYVYIFGYRIPEILRFDMELMEMKSYEGWADRLYAFGRDERYPLFYKDICAVGNSLFLVTGQNNSVVELNMDTDTLEIHPIGEKNHIYSTIAYDGTNFWLAEKNKGILRVDGKSWKWQYGWVKQDIQTDYFVSSIVVDKEIWLFANHDDDIYRVNCLDSSVRRLAVKFDQSDGWYPREKIYGYRFAKRILGEKIAIFCAQDCEMHIFEQEKDMERIKFMTEDFAEEYYRYRMTQRMNINFWFEQNTIFCRMEDYINMIKMLDEVDGREKKEELFGSIIYANIS